MVDLKCRIHALVQFAGKCSRLIERKGFVRIIPAFKNFHGCIVHTRKIPYSGAHAFTCYSCILLYLSDLRETEGDHVLTIGLVLVADAPTHHETYCYPKC